MRVLVEIRCGENAGKCGLLLGEIGKTADDTIQIQAPSWYDGYDFEPVLDEAVGPWKERNESGWFAVPFCRVHNLFLAGPQDARYRERIGWDALKVDAELDEAVRTDTKVVRLVSREDLLRSGREWALEKSSEN